MLKGDKPKTVCVIRHRSYEFFVISFGLVNTFATFCTLMNDVLYELLDHFVVIYLNDIVLYSQIVEKHEKLKIKRAPIIC